MRAEIPPQARRSRGLIHTRGILALTLVTAQLLSTASARMVRSSGSAAGPTVVLADFDNRTGNSLFDYSLTQALSLEMGQSPFLSALPERRITEALQAMGLSSGARITASVGRELCARTDSRDVIRL